VEKVSFITDFFSHRPWDPKLNQGSGYSTSGGSEMMWKYDAWIGEWKGVADFSTHLNSKGLW
jgi:hypothetical protein